jgi:hypothetical protein
VAWCGAVYLGYRLVWNNDSGAPFGFHVEQTELEPNDAANDAVSTAANTATYVAVAPVVENHVENHVENASGPPDTPNTESSESSRALPGCESYLREAHEAEHEPMPTHLGRSVIAPFVEENAWFSPCRGRVRRTVWFCAAIRNGTVIGISLRAAPRDLTLETCVREQALKVSLRAETTLHIVETQLSL